MQVLVIDWTGHTHQETADHHIYPTLFCILCVLVIIAQEGEQREANTKGVHCSYNIVIKCKKRKSRNKTERNIFMSAY